MLERLLLVHASSEVIDILELHVWLVLFVEMLCELTRFHLITESVLRASIVFFLTCRHPIQTASCTIPFSLCSRLPLRFSLPALLLCQEQLFLPEDSIEISWLCSLDDASLLEKLQSRSDTVV